MASREGRAVENGDRGYPVIHIGQCRVQTSEQRFGEKAEEKIKEFLYGSHNLSIAAAGDDDDSSDEDEEQENGDSDAEMADDSEMPGELTDDLSEEMIDTVTGLNLAQLGEGLPSLLTSPSATSSEAQQSIPRMARMRCNLTALSQRFNLYFTAYQDKIYVYQPSSGIQILSSPTMIIKPPKTGMAKVFGGYLERSFGHQMNHMIVGELGNYEVLLVSYDDGDVVAWYTHEIARYIVACIESKRNHTKAETVVTAGVAEQAQTPRTSPRRLHAMPTLKKLLHENVGQSAWGLAIHKKSRLIAASSNRHEVTVFAFATHSRLDIPDRSFKDGSPELPSGHTALQLEQHVQHRTRTWRIILPVGPEGNNIPSISFCDDERGNAEKIVAVDIRGSTWLMDIWKVGTSPIVYPPTSRRGAEHNNYTGWTVLALPNSAFKWTESYRETFGLSRKHILDPPGNTFVSSSDRWINTTCGLFYVPDAAADPKLYLRTRQNRSYIETYNRVGGDELRQAWENEDSSEDDESSSDSEIDTPRPRKQPASSSNWGNLSQPPGPAGSQIDEASELQQGYRFKRAVVPSLGQTPPMGTREEFMSLVSQAFNRKAQTKPVPLLKYDMPRHLARNWTILRTTATDVELQPLDPTVAGVVCKDVLVFHNHRPRRQMPMPFDMHQQISERICMLCHVPELNLVVAGSLTGRVALLTLTRTRKRNDDGVPLRKGFRVDWILPRKQEENARLRPCATLLGVAISPVQDAGARGLSLRKEGWEKRVPTRFRLILHYLDHTILMYEVSRSAEDDLLIF